MTLFIKNYFSVFSIFDKTNPHKYNSTLACNQAYEMKNLFLRNTCAFDIDMGLVCVLV